MKTNCAATPKKEFIIHVINEEKPDVALAQNYLLHHNLDDCVISARGQDYVYVSEILAAFLKFGKNRGIKDEILQNNELLKEMH